ncbi:MAG: AAA family ATPase [Clostridia bacterium]|nr:AAA family ATPase [Clostridia bacterium]
MRKLYLSNRITEVMGGIFEHPLTIVEAPMGYGKTTSVREYLNTTDADTLWLRVYDGSRPGLWNSFCRLFNPLDENRAQMLLKMGFPGEGTLVQEAVGIIEDLALKKRTVLVIDDYHLIDSSEVDFFLESLVKTEIDNLHIVLTARYTGFEKIEEFKLKGYLHYIVKENLEFTPKEIAQYYKSCGISLKAGASNQLYTYTEGWISALYLLMLNYKEFEHLEAPGDIYKLIEKAVYQPFSDEIKDFLLTMCIFDSFTAEQAMFMWGDKNALKLIDEVTGKNAFVRYDAATSTYQMHNIFTNFLKDILDHQTFKKDCYKKAAQWFVKVGAYLESMHYYYLCGDFEHVLAIIEKDKGNSFNSEISGLLLFMKYMEECPQEIKSKFHKALLVYAMHLFTFNEMELFIRTCSELIQNIENDSELSEDLKRELLGEYELLISFIHYNDINKMSQHQKKACKLLSKSTDIYDTNIYWTFGSPSVLYMFYRESGKLEQHVEDIKEALPYYHQLTDGHGIGGQYIMEAERHFYMGALESAEIVLHKALHIIEGKNEPVMMLCAEFLQVRIALMKGDLSEVFGILGQMRQNMMRKNEFHSIYTIELCEGYIYALLKQKNKISESISEWKLSSTRIMFPAYAMVGIVYGRSLLLNGQYLKLIGIFEQMMGMASIFPNLLAVVHNLIYLSAANEKIYRHEEALSTLRQALEIAMPDQLYMPFVENGDYIKPLLEEIGREKSDRESIDHILELYGCYEKSVNQAIEEYFDNAKPKLSEREREIAVLAAQGLTNKEISGRLFISQNTVKTQLKTVFEKLGINSRALLKQVL